MTQQNPAKLYALVVGAILVGILGLVAGLASTARRAEPAIGVR